MCDLLQDNLLYLYKNNVNIFNKIQDYLAQNLPKRFDLAFDNREHINITYVMNNETHWLYAEDGSDVERWIKENIALTKDCFDVVMYGLGLTHHLAKLIENNSLLNFYIIEPEIDLFIEALKVINVKDLLNHPQVKQLEIGKDDKTISKFHSFFNVYSEYQSIDVYIPYYSSIDIESMRKFYKTNYAHREGRILEWSFEQRFGTQPYRNSIRNIEAMSRSDSLKVLHHKFMGCTALIVGAGPSLEKDIVVMKEHYDKLLIIAAGSSIQSLLHYGIKPHLVVSMDPSEANGRVFRRVATNEIPLVFIPPIYYEILHERFLRVFYAFFTDDPITKYLFSGNDINYSFFPTVTVTGTAIQVARYLGASQILLSGQDLSFPTDNYYAQGAGHNDSQGLDMTVNLSNLKVENVQGGINRTNNSMRVALENIEELLEAMPEVEFINTSALGAKIKGAMFIPLAEVMASLKHSPFNFNSLTNVKNRDDTIAGYEYDCLIEKLNDTLEKLEQFIHINENCLKIIQKIDEHSRMNSNKAMSLLVKLEQEFSKVTDHELFTTIIPKWNWGITQKYDQQVMKIESEPTMIGKAKLLNQIVVPYINTLSVSFNELREEFQNVLENLKINRD